MRACSRLVCSASGGGGTAAPVSETPGERHGAGKSRDLRKSPGSATPPA